MKRAPAPRTPTSGTLRQSGKNTSSAAGCRQSIEETISKTPQLRTGILLQILLAFRALHGISILPATIQAVHYDICDPDIRCNADKIGATVFEVHRGKRTLRVLTFDQQRAEEIARDHENASMPIEEESWLF